VIRIVVSGMCASEICRLAADLGGSQVQVRETIDIAGATEVAQGRADYYFGACATGAGGALALAIAILGYDSCFLASMVGRPPDQAEIGQAVTAGKRAFGFTVDHIDSAVPMLLTAILARQQELQDKQV
jgi:hypothetical protein